MPTGSNEAGLGHTGKISGEVATYVMALVAEAETMPYQEHTYL